MYFPARLPGSPQIVRGTLASRLGRGFTLLRRAATVAFVGLFLALGVAQGMPAGHPVRRQLAPLTTRVAPLRLHTPWRMFVGRARFGDVLVEGRRADGQRVMVATFRHEGKPLLARVRDERLRKLHAKLKGARARNTWAPSYLDYLCRTRAAAGVPSLEVVLRKPLIENDDGVVVAQPTRKVLLRHRCGPGNSGAEAER